MTREELEKTSVFQNVCDVCARKILHPPISIPASRAVPLKHQLGTYKIIDTKEVCHLCAAEILAEGGEFQTKVLGREFEPKILWDVVEQDDGSKILKLREADD